MACFRNVNEIIAELYSPERDRADKPSKERLEAYQAALFGHAYASALHLSGFEIRLGEGSLRDSDADFRWDGTPLAKVQLKRLPNKTTGPTESMQSLLDKAVRRCTGNDLIFALNVDRTIYNETLTIPTRCSLREICVWGWADPHFSRIALARYVIGQPSLQEYEVPFPPPGMLRVSRSTPKA